ncbi:hypothetical protein C8F04DRAFT_1264961 [Mycena alexandri]|uniref:Uncharacterized protein n=1 Tax=Mycena alexandri TaxID=1745969 RepID=A0AAD6SL65_9AGAR|nr:hypothetical protein C8F04DRAFT_1264961 [Mycena alexandri]
MTSEGDNVDAPVRMRAREYDVATTKVIYGLSPVDQHVVLATLRTDFHTPAAEQRCMERGDDDSLFSADDEEPPLMPVSPSDEESDTRDSPAGQTKDMPVPAPVSAAVLLNDAPQIESGHRYQTDGEAVESAWAAAGPVLPRPMGAGLRHLAEEGPIHDLQIVGLNSVRDVKCNCIDGKHSAYERRWSFGYINADGIWS